MSQKKLSIIFNEKPIGVQFIPQLNGEAEFIISEIAHHFKISHSQAVRVFEYAEMNNMSYQNAFRMLKLNNFNFF